MDYDIMIIAYKRPKMLRELLDSIPKGIADIFIYFDNNDIETYNKFKDNNEYKCILLLNQNFCLKINNLHCSQSTKKGVINLNDDMRMEPLAIENVIKAFEKMFPDTNGLVGMNQFLIPTGSPCAAWLIGKKFSDRFPNREAIFPGYVGRFGDTELMQTAQNLGCFYWCKEAKIHHWQPDSLEYKDSYIADETRKKQESTQDKDSKLYSKRQLNNLYMKRVIL